MFARVACPACQHKFSIPEGEMGRRQVCPNCRSPFVAGKSVAEADAGAAPARPQGATPESSYNKTMLGDTQPPIKYNCPRCKAPLEAPSIEAGTKKPCPACGQRLQVPNAPPVVAATGAAAPNLNKTLLASDESRQPPPPPLPPIKYNCPNCKKPLESPASEALTKKPCPACGQRLQVPAAPAGPPQPNLNKTVLATDESKPQSSGYQPGYAAGASPTYGSSGSAPTTTPAGQITIGTVNIPTKGLAIGLGGFFLLLLLICVIPALFRGGRHEDPAKMAEYQDKIKRLEAEIEQKKLFELEKQKQLEATAEQLKAFRDAQRAQEERLLFEHRQLLSSLKDQAAKQEAEDAYRRSQRKLEEERREMADKQAKLLEKLQKDLADSTAALKEAKTQQQTVIQQPPVVYYPPYHWRYYYGW